MFEISEREPLDESSKPGEGGWGVMGQEGDRYLFPHFTQILDV